MTRQLKKKPQRQMGFLEGLSTCESILHQWGEIPEKSVERDDSGLENLLLRECSTAPGRWLSLYSPEVRLFLLGPAGGEGDQPRAALDP